MSVDDTPVDLSETVSFKGMMYSGAPNLDSAIGYTNASWTLKCDLTCECVCRLLNYTDRRGVRQCTPQRPDLSAAELPWIDFSSGYVQRSIDQQPRQGAKTPWRLHQNYVLDLLTLRGGTVNDGVMQFSGATPAATRVQQAEQR